jgi:hypothetical protein
MPNILILVPANRFIPLLYIVSSAHTFSHLPELSCKHIPPNSRPAYSLSALLTESLINVLKLEDIGIILENNV